MLPAAVGVTVAIVAAAGSALLLSYHAPTREHTAPAVRESVPDVTSRAPARATVPAPPAVAPGSPPPPPSAPARPDPSAHSVSPSPTPTVSGGTSPAASPSPSPTPSGTPGGTATAPAPVLRRGDTGPEVSGLQRRLRRLNLYGDRIDGVYTRHVEDAVRAYQLARGVTGDPPGEYGPATRKSLEAETTDP